MRALRLRSSRQHGSIRRHRARRTTGINAHRGARVAAAAWRTWRFALRRQKSAQWLQQHLLRMPPLHAHACWMRSMRRINGGCTAHRCYCARCYLVAPFIRSAASSGRASPHMNAISIASWAGISAAKKSFSVYQMERGMDQTASARLPPLRCIFAAGWRRRRGRQTC